MTDNPPDTVKFHRDDHGQWHWTLRAAGNHEIIAASTEGYVHRTDAEDNFERVTGRDHNPWEESLG
jgi:uncharacterized protein YegP (UPF0339 family)